jgi:tetratricopeptide (TPR) repeat protein
MLRFLKKQGATDDELGRVMAASTSGDQRSFDEAVKKVMERTMMGKDGPSMEELKEKMAKIDSVTNAVQNDLVGAIEGLGGGAKSAGAPPSTAEKGANKNKGKGKEKEKEAAPEPTKAPTSAVAKGNAEECKAQGNKLFAAGDYAAAVECFKQAVALSSTPNAGYLTNLAASRLRMGDWDAAVRDADAALAADGTHVKAWFRKGQALEGKCDWDGAEAAYRGGLEHMPDSEQLKAGLESVSAARRKSKEGEGSSGVKEGCEAAVRKEQDKDKSKDKEEGAKLLGTAIAAKLKERREEKLAAAPAAATAGDVQTGPKTPQWQATKSGESLVVSIEMPLLDKAIADLTLDVSRCVSAALSILVLVSSWLSSFMLEGDCWFEDAALFSARNRNQRNPWHCLFAADASNDIHSRSLH